MSCSMQALNIPTKINRGTVEIVSDVHLIKQSEKVGGSEATLLSKLGIKPFSYGLVLLKVLSHGRSITHCSLWDSESALSTSCRAPTHVNMAVESTSCGFSLVAQICRQCPLHSLALQHVPPFQ